MSKRRCPGPAYRQSNGARLQNAAYGIPPAEELSRVTAFDGVRTFVAGWWHEPTKTFYKFLKPVHILQKPPSIAVQVCVVEKLDRWRCEWIAAVTPDGDILTVPFALFTRKAEPFNRGFGTQLRLPLDHWTSLRKTRLQPALTGLEV